MHHRSRLWLLSASRGQHRGITPPRAAAAQIAVGGGVNASAGKGGGMKACGGTLSNLWACGTLVRVLAVAWPKGSSALTMSPPPRAPRAPLSSRLPPFLLHLLVQVHFRGPRRPPTTGTRALCAMASVPCIAFAVSCRATTRRLYPLQACLACIVYAVVSAISVARRSLRWVHRALPPFLAPCSC